MTDKTPQANDLVRARTAYRTYVDGYVIRTNPDSQVCFVEWDDGDATYCDYRDMQWEANLEFEGWRF